MSYTVFLAEFPWFAPIASFLLGAIVGSFLNVCIYRIPANKSVVHPGSHCACGKPVAWHDNIPILSWFLLRGKARCCGAPFSFRYPAIEALTGALFTANWLLLPHSVAVCGWIFTSCLLCASFIDLDHFEIPDLFSVGLAVFGVILSVFVPSLHGQSHEIHLVACLRSGLISLQGLLLGSALVLWIALISEAILKREAMGVGDIKFVGAIGAFCGWQGAVTAIFGGAIVGSLWFAFALIWEKVSGKPLQLRKPDSDEKAELGMGALIPYGPMLALAGLAHFLYFYKVVNPRFAEFASILQ